MWKLPIILHGAQTILWLFVLHSPTVSFQPCLCLPLIDVMLACMLVSFASCPVQFCDRPTWRLSDVTSSFVVHYCRLGVWTLVLWYLTVAFSWHGMAWFVFFLPRRKGANTLVFLLTIVDARKDWLIDSFIDSVVIRVRSTTSKLKACYTWIRFIRFFLLHIFLPPFDFVWFGFSVH